MNFHKSRSINFDLPNLPGSANLGHGNAAGLGGFTGVYGSNLKTAPRYDELAATSVATRSNERAAITKAEADVHSAGLQSVASVEAARLQAEAAKDAARSQAQGSIAGSALGMIGSIGGALIGLSDETTKENIKSIDDGLALIRRLNPSTYNYKDEWQGYSDRHQNGFIAQEFKEVFPEGTYNSKQGKMCIDITQVIAPLVRAVQQLEDKVARLEAERSFEGAI